MRQYPLPFKDYSASRVYSLYCYAGGCEVPFGEYDHCPSCQGMGRCLTCDVMYEWDANRIDCSASDRTLQKPWARPTRRCPKCHNRPDILGLKPDD